MKRIRFPWLKILLFTGMVLFIPLCFFLRPGFGRYSREISSSQELYTLYLVNNGWHQELALPQVRCGVEGGPKGSPQGRGYFLVGWGDREFFLNTPYLEMLTLQKTFRALFLPSSSVVKISTLQGRPRTGPTVREIPVTGEMLCRIYRFMVEERISDVPLPAEMSHPAYGEARFFPAKSRYSLLYTCNNWSGRALRKAGIPTGIWTPWTAGVGPSVRQLERLSPRMEDGL